MQLFSFNGRIRRRDYWLYNFGLGVMGAAINIFTLESVFELALVIFIAILFSWIYYATGAKRCHDCGYCGWWQIVPFFPIVLAFKPGVTGPNEYGPDPKDTSAGLNDE